MDVDRHLAWEDKGSWGGSKVCLLHRALRGIASISAENLGMSCSAGMLDSGLVRRSDNLCHCSSIDEVEFDQVVSRCAGG